MAKGVNKVILLGHVGKAPGVRTTQGGTTVATFSFATAERVKDQGGNYTDKTEWHACVAFGRTAEILRDYVNKGSKLLLEGKLQTRSWDDKESGKKCYRTEIVIFELIMLDKRPDARQGDRDDTEQRSNVYDTHGAGRSASYEHQGITDEDIPF